MTVTDTELHDAKIRALDQLRHQVKVQGFRKGKVPASVAEKNLDPNVVANEAMQYAVNRAMNDAINDENLRVVDQPKIEVTKYIPYTELEFTAEMEILPEITLGDYRNLKAKKEKVVVEEKEVTEVIDRMRQGFADKKDVKRAAKNGDEATIDFEGKDKKGQPIANAKSADYPLLLGSDTFIPGFENGVIGHKAGETFDFDVTFPKKYHAADLQGQKVTFTVTIKKLQEVILPKVDDEFVKKVGQFDTVKAMKEDIKNELKAQKERSALEKFKDDLLGELADKTKVSLPEVLVADQLAAIEQEMTQNLIYRGQSVEQYLEANGYKDKDDWHKKELQEAAERRVKAGLVLAELSKLEDISVSKEELEEELTRRKQEAPKIAAQLDTPDARRDLANRVITQKTIERLVELNIK